MKSVALDLVKESFGDSLYGKALDCIKALREEALKVMMTLHLPCLLAAPITHFVLIASQVKCP